MSGNRQGVNVNGHEKKFALKEECTINLTDAVTHRHEKKEKPNDSLPSDYFHVEFKFFFCKTYTEDY